MSLKANNAITSLDAIMYLSIASLWEIAIKVNIGKLILEMPFKDLRQQIDINGFELLPINFDHTATLSSLPLHHNDPFDRIIIAQALTENLTAISKDEHFTKYPELLLLW